MGEPLSAPLPHLMTTLESLHLKMECWSNPNDAASRTFGGLSSLRGLSLKLQEIDEQCLHTLLGGISALRTSLHSLFLDIPGDPENIVAAIKTLAGLQNLVWVVQDPFLSRKPSQALVLPSLVSLSIQGFAGLNAIQSLEAPLLQAMCIALGPEESPGDDELIELGEAVLTEWTVVLNDQPRFPSLEVMHYTMVYWEDKYESKILSAFPKLRHIFVYCEDSAIRPIACTYFKEMANGFLQFRIWPFSPCLRSTILHANYEAALQEDYWSWKTLTTDAKDLLLTLGALDIQTPTDFHIGLPAQIVQANEEIKNQTTFFRVAPDGHYQRFFTFPTDANHQRLGALLSH